MKKQCQRTTKGIENFQFINNFLVKFNIEYQFLLALNIIYLSLKFKKDLLNDLTVIQMIENLIEKTRKGRSL